MRKYLPTLAWPVICGILLGVVILNYVPQFNFRSSSLESAGSGITDAPTSYANAVQRAAPAVVMISALGRQGKKDSSPLGDDPIYRPYQKGNGNDDSEQPVNLGSGVIADKHGYILTNNHVVSASDKIQVTLPDGRATMAKLVGSDPDTDLAVLKISLDNLPTVNFMNSNDIRTGDVALAIGNPFNIGQSVTMGIVSAVGRATLGLTAYENFIQTDASINPGNSGGALINSQGKLIGINTAIFSRRGGSQGIGFAIPTNVARTVLDSIIRYGRVQRGWLGIDARQQPDQTGDTDIQTQGNLVIVRVEQGGPADKAGIQRGDYIQAINGVPILNPGKAIEDIANVRPGRNVTLTILRNGEQEQLPITVGVRPQNQPTSFYSEEAQSTKRVNW